MKNIYRPLLLLSCYCLLQSCAFMEVEALWLTSGSVKMKDYQRETIVLLPLIVDPKYRLTEQDEQQLEVLHNAVKTNLRRVFKLRPDALRTIDPVAYPLTTQDLVDIGELYQARAVVSVSIFSLVRNAASQQVVSLREVGAKIGFVDIDNTDSYWTMSRVYQAQDGLALDSVNFDDIIKQDFSDVKRLLLTWRFFPQFGTPEPEPVGPSLSMVSLDLDNDQSPGKLNSEATTSKNSLKVRLLIDDVTPLSSLNITSTQQGDEFINLSAVDIYNIDRVFYVPLAPGDNQLVFTATNQQGIATTRTLNVRRENRNSAALIAVLNSSLSAIPFYRPKYNQQQLEQLLADYGNSIYLYDESAVRNNFIWEMEKLSERAYSDDNFTPFVYFSGQFVQRSSKRSGDSKYYLMTNDSRRNYLNSTAVSLASIFDILGDNAFVIIENCAADKRLLGEYRLPERRVLINIRRCDVNDREVATRILNRIKQGDALEDIVAHELRNLDSLPVFSQQFEDPWYYKKYSY